MGAKNNNAIYQLQPKFLVTNFNFDAMAATVTQSDTSFKNTGVFRTKTDLVGMSWFAEDNLSHLDFRYPLKKDFSGVTLSYHYEISGHTPLLDAEAAAPTITVRTEDGEYYVRLWNYVVDRPLDSWEVSAGEYLHEDVCFPAGRKPGTATGEKGNIVIDFDHLYAGWTPYIWQNPGGVGEWVENPDWVKIPVDRIREVMWSFVPLDYNTGEGYLEDSMPYAVTFTDWTVSGNCGLGTEAPGQAVTQVRLCDDYDDIYNMTPERVVSEYERLGYRSIVNCYIGASHYYDKCYSGGKMNVKTDYPFNPAFEAWYGDYLRRLHALGVKVIHSISMECVDPPEDWKQRNWAGVAGTTNWEPKPSLLSFVNYDVKTFYISYVKGLARLSTEAGMQPVIQLGESWWWYIEDGVDNSPCFYDNATRDEYKVKYGRDMHVFRTGNDPIGGHEDVLYFLREKNGEFTHLLRNELKAAYPGALFTVLFFPPSVMDKTRTPEMMSIVNLPAEYWIYPNLDFFMLEDYDYLIDNHMWKHRDAINFVQNNLAYPPDKIHYFAGFVLNADKIGVWKNINQAIVDGFNEQFAEVYVWAYAQVKRDGWHPLVLVSATPKPGNYAGPLTVTLSGTAGSQISYTTGQGDARMVAAAESHSVPISGNTTLHVTARSGSRENTYDLTYTTPMREVEGRENIVDGDASEWRETGILAVGGKGTGLSARTDSRNLYVMASAPGLGGAQRLCLYIDMEGNSLSGFRETGWANAGIDYKVENEEIYRYTGTGTENSWEKTGTVSFARTSSCAEWGIPFSLINRTLALPLYIGLEKSDGEHVPMLTNHLAVVECKEVGSEGRYVVIPKVLNIRSTPVADETNANKITSVDQGDRITVLYKVIGEDGGLWAAVELDNDIKGWVSDALILPDKPVVTTFEKEVAAYIDEVKYTLTPLEDWGQAGKGHYNGKPLMTPDGKYNIAIGPKVMNPKYPDDGQILEEDFDAFNREADVDIRNKENGEIMTLKCYVRDWKAHTYNKYPVKGHEGDGDVVVETESGLIQTGIRYPYAKGMEWAENTFGGNIIEFCSDNTGTLVCTNYILEKVTVYFKDKSNLGV